ncbi:type VI secretion system protein TssA [Paraburkholderia rhizosphaerae]
MTPVNAASPCGPDLEYDPEWVVLTARVVAKTDAQYGDFVGTPEPVNWSEVERECRRLMLRSKDMRVAVLFTRCRTRLEMSKGLAEGLRLLAAWLDAFPDTIHPQPGVDDDQDAALEIRMNALQALTDTDGLMSDVREIALTRSTMARLQVRDVERAFAHPRPNDSLAPDSVTRQLEDIRAQQPDTLAGFDEALASLGAIENWCKQHLGVYQPDLSALNRLLRRLTGDGPRSVQPSIDAQTGHVSSVNAVETRMPDQDAPRELAEGASPRMTTGPVEIRCEDAPRDRDDALGYIRDARRWFELHEPSSPIPILLRRAEQFVGKGYADAVRAIPAELLIQWESEE